MIRTGNQHIALPLREQLQRLSSTWKSRPSAFRRTRTSRVTTVTGNRGSQHLDRRKVRFSASASRSSTAATRALDSMYRTATSPRCRCVRATRRTVNVDQFGGSSRRKTCPAILPSDRQLRSAGVSPLSRPTRRSGQAGHSFSPQEGRAPRPRRSRGSNAVMRTASKRLHNLRNRCVDWPATFTSIRTGHASAGTMRPLPPPLRTSDTARGGCSAGWRGSALRCRRRPSSRR